MKITICVIALLALSACTNTMNMLENADYICVTGQLDGPWTDSAANGRGIKVPEGESLTPELAEILCR